MYSGSYISFERNVDISVTSCHSCPARLLVLGIALGPHVLQTIDIGGSNDTF